MSSDFMEQLEQVLADAPVLVASASSLDELARVVGLRLTLVPDQPLIEKIDTGTLFE